MRNLRSIAGVAALAAFLALPAAPCLAQQVTFDPSIYVQWGYTDNVQFLGEDGELNDTSTSIAQIGVSLPVTRQLRNGTLTFRYDTGYSQYEEFDALDHDNHELAFDLRRTTGRRGTLTFSTWYLRTQNQVGLGDFNRSFFLGPRQDQDVLNAEVGYSREMGERWTWQGALGASTYDYSEIADFDNMADQVLVEDRDLYYGTTGASRQVSKKTRVGGEYTFRRSELEVSGDEDLHRLASVIDRTLGRRAAVTFRIGGFFRSNSRFAQDRENGMDIGVNLRFNDEMQAGPVRFGLSAGVRPDAGGDLGGTSLNTYVGFVLSGAETRYWRWSTAARWARRDPLDDSTLPEVDLFGVNGTVERRVAKVLGIRVQGGWFDQTSSDSAAYEGSYYTASLGVAWYPLAKSRISGRRAGGS